MHRRFRPTTKLRTGVRLRTLMYGGVVCFGLVLGFAFFVIQFLREETGQAADNPMIISGIEVTQDTTTVFRGTSLQPMLRINIQTKGINHKLSLNSIELSARGTSNEVYNLIENARLWATGGNVYYTDSKQLGTTLKEIPKGNFTFTCIQNLMPGNNYFWLTYDISAKPITGNFFADAECISIKIGTLDYDPAISAPPGVRTILNNVPYFSTGNGDISSLESWNTARDGSGKSPVNFSTTPATYHIQAGHIMNNTLSACIPVLLIEKNGVLKSSSDLKANLLEIQQGGTYIQEKALTKPDVLKIFKVKDNGNYVHANTGSLPGSRKIIEPNSTITLTAYSGLTFSQQVTWGNLVIDAKENATVNFGNALKNIKGNLEIRATGKNEFIFTSVSDTININGDLIINGGRLIMCCENNSINLCIGKTIAIKNGWFSDLIKGKSGNGKLELNSGSGYAFTGGEFQIISPGSEINVTKSDVSWIQLAKAEVKLPDISIYSGSKLIIRGQLFGQIGKGRTLKVNNGGTIEIESAEITGEGSFVLNDGATMSTGHPKGINSFEQTGCIQTFGRTFHSGANYFFTGYTSPQQTGVFNTVPEFETVNNMGIAKAAANGILILNQNIKVNGNLVRTRGSINKNSYSILYHEQGEETAVKPSQHQNASF